MSLPLCVSVTLLIKLGGIRFELRDTQQLATLFPDAAIPLPTSYIYLKVCSYGVL